MHVTGTKEAVAHLLRNIADEIEKSNMPGGWQIVRLDHGRLITMYPSTMVTDMEYVGTTFLVSSVLLPVDKIRAAIERENGL